MAEYIERKSLIDEFDRLGLGDHSFVERVFSDGVRTIIAGIPAADVVPVVHGVWIPVHESEISGWNPEVAGIDPIGGYICSACKNEAVYDCNDKFVLSDYCPWCGARMDGDSDAKAD